jgi:hypothetical protein
VRVVALLVVVACGRSAPPATPAPIAAPPAAHSCREAAVGLESATRDLRAPETSIVRAMDERCVADHWPTIAIDCFATMSVGELARCATRLPDRPRDAMLAVLSGGDDRAAIASARLRLQGLQLGVVECDQFVAAVASVLDCEQMPLGKRIQLGNETAELWQLPTHSLPADAQRRMADACGSSLALLEAEASNAGCNL